MNLELIALLAIGGILLYMATKPNARPSRNSRRVVRRNMEDSLRRGWIREDTRVATTSILADGLSDPSTKAQTQKMIDDAKTIAESASKPAT